MASPGNRHCANCIGTLSFPIQSVRVRVLQSMVHQLVVLIRDALQRKAPPDVDPGLTRTDLAGPGTDSLASVTSQLAWQNDVTVQPALPPPRAPVYASCFHDDDADGSAALLLPLK